jgi:hypothetical protein
MQYESTKTVESSVCEGVRFTIARMTFGRRIELMKRVRKLSAEYEFERAGSTLEDQLKASLTAAAIDELYLKWGLISLDGLAIDGRVAEPEALALCGPEALCHEVIATIKRECALTEEDRKN